MGKILYDSIMTVTQSYRFLRAFRQSMARYLGRNWFNDACQAAFEKQRLFLHSATLPTKLETGGKLIDFALRYLEENGSSDYVSLLNLD